MQKTPIDHDHLNQKTTRARRFSRLDRITAGEGKHPSVRQLMRRRRAASGARIKQYLRIARGYIA